MKANQLPNIMIFSFLLALLKGVGRGQKYECVYYPQHLDNAYSGLWTPTGQSSRIGSSVR